MGTGAIGHESERFVNPKVLGYGTAGGDDDEVRENHAFNDAGLGVKEVPDSLNAVADLAGRQGEYPDMLACSHLSDGGIDGIADGYARVNLLDPEGGRRPIPAKQGLLQNVETVDRRRNKIINQKIYFSLTENGAGN